MTTRTSLEWSFALVGLPTRKFRTWSSGEFQITEWPYGFVLVKNCTRIGEYPTLEIAQAAAEAIEPAAHSPVTVQPNLPAVDDDVVATVYLGSAGTMNVRAKVKVVHGNGTLRVSYLKRTGKTFTKEVVTECRTWRHLTDEEKAKSKPVGNMKYWTITVGDGYGSFVIHGCEAKAEEMRVHKARWEQAVARKRLATPEEIEKFERDKLGKSQ